MAARATPVPRLARVAATHQLGGCRAVHAGLTELVWASLGGIALGVALVSFRVVQPYLGERYQDDAIIGIVVPVLGVLSLFVGLVGFLGMRGRRIQIHDRGILCKDWWTVRTIRYADVIALKQNITEVMTRTGPTFRGDLVAYRRDGSKARLPLNIEGLDAVVEALVRGAAPSVKQHVLAALRAGHTVPSGVLNLTPAGLQHKRRLIPYAAISRVREGARNSMLMRRKLTYLEVTTTDGGAPIEVRAGAVLHGSYLQAIAEAMARGH